MKISGSDVQAKIKIYLKDAIFAGNISVKLVSNLTGFNQMDKRWIDKYAELWKHVSKRYYQLFKMNPVEIINENNNNDG